MNTDLHCSRLILLNQCHCLIQYAMWLWECWSNLSRHQANFFRRIILLIYWCHYFEVVVKNSLLHNLNIGRHFVIGVAKLKWSHVRLSPSLYSFLRLLSWHHSRLLPWSGRSRSNFVGSCISHPSRCRLIIGKHIPTVVVGMWPLQIRGHCQRRFAFVGFVSMLLDTALDAPL